MLWVHPMQMQHANNVQKEDFDQDQTPKCYCVMPVPRVGMLWQAAQNVPIVWLDNTKKHQQVAKRVVPVVCPAITPMHQIWTHANDVQWDTPNLLPNKRRACLV